MTDKRNNWCVIALIAIGVFVLFYRLGERDMWIGLEAEAALMGQDMLQTGRILVPHIFDEPFVDNRPPGAFWTVAGSFAVTGRRDEFAARLPFAIAALICVIMVYAIGRRVAGPRAGLLSGLILLGMMSFVDMARRSQADMLLTLFTLLACWAFWRSLDARGSGLRFVLLFQVFVGLGVLAKGPAIGTTVLIPLAVYIGLSRRWRDVKWWPLVLTAPIGLALMLWWYAYVWIAWPSMREVLINRFTNQSNIHQEPFYYYVISLPALLGLVIPLLPALCFGWKRADAAERRGPFGLFLCVVLSTFAVHTLLGSKRLHYLIPVMPSLAVALGLAIDRLKWFAGRFLSLGALWTATLAPFLVAGWIFGAPDEFRPDGAIRDWAALVTLAGIAVWAWHMKRSGRPAATFFVAWTGTVLLLGFGVADVQQRVIDSRSARSFGETVSRLVPPESRLGTLTEHGALAYYVDRPMVSLTFDQVEEFIRIPGHYLIAIVDEGRSIDGSDWQVVHQSRYRHGDTAYLLRGASPAVHPTALKKRRR